MYAVDPRAYTLLSDVYAILKHWNDIAHALSGRTA